jgi:hypothetical protein
MYIYINIYNSYICVIYIPESAPKLSFGPPEPVLGLPLNPGAPNLELGDVGESRFSQSPVSSFLW